ncbi:MULTISPECIES: ABC transporter substrate-binding protein [Roseomonadaceae]|uniref:ABC transporter substrate-binding protein n=1 Tax=Falsiroseomonas oleicola TaxID=2801474 RepID=A0ABS6H830_9PROT|nr:ABC transporter substrate-binding protein [Roseomonas oleicola]MBU8544861.1 ABC transporter substrate-binding protein [Roseomonas oleicola]
MKTGSLKALLLAGCLAGAGLPQPAAAQTLRMAVGAQVTSLDPHYHNISPNNAFAATIFSNLMEMDPNSRPVAALAESWRPVGEDVWELKLRAGVTFHDGTPFTADDVAFTLDRIPKVANSPGSFRTYTHAIIGVEVVDPLTVRLRTQGPDPVLPANLSQVPMLSRKIHEGASTEDFNSGRVAIGTGPYRMSGGRSVDRMELQRNDSYWGGREPWERVEYRMVTNAAARTSTLLAGDVDFIDQVPTADLARMRQDANIRISEIDSLRLIYFHFDHMRDGPSPFITDNAGQPLPRNPLRDVRVRRALALAIDRAAIVERVMEGNAAPINQFMPAGGFGHVPELAPPPPADPAAARRLLAEAGYPEGFRITLHGPNDRYPNDARIVQAVAQMWSRIGVRTAVDVQPFSNFVTRASRQEFSSFLVSWGSSTGEPSGGMRSVLASYERTRGMGAVNRGRYANPRFDALLTRGMRELDDAKREAVLQEAMRLAMDDQAIIPMHVQRNVWAMRQGFTHTPRTDERTRPQDVRPAG